MEAFDITVECEMVFGWLQSTFDRMSSHISKRFWDAPSPTAEVQDGKLGLYVKPVGSKGELLINRLRLKFSSDEDLAIRLGAGETDALTVLFERFSSQVFHLARRILRDAAEAEDAVQQIFLDFYSCAEKFDPAKGAFKPWFLMFSYCRVLNLKRRLQSRAFYDSDSFEEFSPEVAQARERVFPFNIPETLCLVQETLKLIKPRQRRVIELVYYEGFTSDEVAERTGESVRVVRHHLYRGLEKIRSVLRCEENKSDLSNHERLRKEVRP